MKTGYTIYRTNGTKELSSLDWPEDPGYSAIKALVQPIVGDSLEHVTVLHDGERKDMFVDELGHVRKGGPKPLNEAATEIYHAVIVAYGWNPETLPTIVGDAVLFHRRVWF